MEGIIFDFNGTMFFDQSIQEQAWRGFLKDLTGRDATDAEFQEYIHGRSIEATLSYFLGRDVPREEAAALEEQKEYVYRTLCQKSSIFRLANGLPQFLDELSRRKILVNIATASGHTNVRFFFGQLALGRWFDLRRVVLNDGTFPCKPAPDIFLRAAEKLGLPPAGCAIFEDSRAGIQSACRAGAGLVVGVSSMLPAEELYTLGANAVISDYRDLPELLRLLGCC